VDRFGIGVPNRADLLVSQAWLRGVLPADRLRLDALVAELSRYRPGVLRCHEQVSGLRLTGSFSLDDTDAALTLVARTLPVRIERMTRYWVSIVPA
jgi:transmembrane sensor